MKKSTLLLIITLAIAAFFSHSPEAKRLVANTWARLNSHGVSRPAAVEADAAEEAQVPVLRYSESPSQAGEPLYPPWHNSGVPAEEAETTDPELENEKLAQAAAEVPDNDLRSALDSNLGDHGDFASQLRELLIRRWAEIDPAAAASWASGVQDTSIALSVAKQIATAWANKDLSAAVEWVGTLPDGPTRQAAVLSLGYEAARSNSFDAFDLVASLPPSSERDSLLVHIARQWAAADPAEAAIWANRVPDSALRDRLVSAVAVASATKDPASAASLIATSLTPGREQDQAAIAIVQRWAQTDPQATASWISIFPDPAVTMAAASAFSSVQPKLEN